MIVQERGNGKRRSEEGESKGLVADSGDDSDKEIEHSHSHFEVGYDEKRKVPWNESLGCPSCIENLPKFLLFIFIISSFAVLLYNRKGSEAAAIVCIEELAQNPEAIPYPEVDLKHIKRVKDFSRWASVSADKWIVVTVSRAPTPEVKEFVKVKDWKVLAIGTDEAPADWRVPDVIFLSVDQQAELGYRINAFLPHHSYIRKNIGYLFAIQHGARKIYDADETASLLEKDFTRVFDVELSGTASKRDPVLQYRYVDTRKVVNPYIHFGQRSVWPRGLPLEAVNLIAPEVMYAQVTRGKQYIQQSLANGLPDVDSIFYLTRKSQQSPLNIQFDSWAPPVVLPQGYMAPVNALNTLFHYSAFWALLLPVSVGTKTADIVRGYWGQRLLWEVGGVLGVYPPLIRRKDTLLPPPFEEEKDLHAKVRSLVSFLLEWRSHKSGLYQRIIHLSHSLAQEGFWARQDVLLTAVWLQDLVSIGYMQPRLMSLELDRNRSSWSTLGHATFSPHAFGAPYLGIEDTTGMGSQMTDLIRWRQFFGNIVLVMEFEGPTHHTVLAWRMFYGRLFKHIVMLAPEANPELGVEALDGPSYNLLTGIFDRYPNSDGFLLVKDDVVLNYWNLVGASKKKLWNVHKVPALWRFLSLKDNGTEGLQSAEMKNNVKTASKNMPPEFRKGYRKSIVTDDRYVACKSDVYYVPQRYVTNFIKLITPVARAKLPEELAIPMIFLALDRPENFDTTALSNTLEIDEARLKKNGGDPAAFYRADVDVVHPWTASTEEELGRLWKKMGKNDLHLLDAFD